MTAIASIASAQLTSTHLARRQIEAQVRHECDRVLHRPVVHDRALRHEDNVVEHGECLGRRLQQRNQRRLLQAVAHSAQPTDHVEQRRRILQQPSAVSTLVLYSPRRASPHTEPNERKLNVRKVEVLTLTLVNRSAATQRDV